LSFKQFNFFVVFFATSIWALATMFSHMGLATSFNQLSFTCFWPIGVVCPYLFMYLHFHIILQIFFPVLFHILILHIISPLFTSHIFSVPLIVLLLSSHQYTCSYRTVHYIIHTVHIHHSLCS
jgi:hypothetical protein